MDIGKSFTFLFDDESWISKLVIGALVAIIPIVNFAALGYIIQLIRNVRDGHERPLPEWGGSFGEFFMDGLKVFLGLVVYYLPMLVPVGLVAIITAALGTAGGDTADTILPLVVLCFQCFIFVLAIVPYLLIPALFARYAEYGEIGAMFQLGEVWAFIQRDMGSYLIVLLLFLGVSTLLAPLGMLACVVGVFLTNWWAYLVFGHLTGQLAAHNASL